MLRGLFYILCIMTALGSCNEAWGAFKSKTDAVSTDSTWNPAPMKDDITLPMPCGLKMTLRAVQIPSGALIQDKTFAMGVNNIGETGRELYERQFDGHIAAPFTMDNLPQAWQSALADSGAKTSGDTWYFIGKYEVSRMQWDAVMNTITNDGAEDASACPTGSPDANLPAASVSWFEAQEFLNKYNAWLVKNHPQDLPAIKGTQNIAFVRLPTEEEWEYAARGGSKVPPEWWAEEDFFPAPDGQKVEKLEDYGVYTKDSAMEKPMAIGSRNPNPLGVYDTTGNVREMVDGFFRMSIADMRNGQMERRLHGAAGGILAKGGGFRSQEESVLPGARDEIPLYTANGPSRPDDLGFRVALSALNIPTSERYDQLKAEEKNAPSPKAAAAPSPAQRADLRGAKTPEAAVEALIAATQGDVKRNLQQVKAMLADQAAADARENRKNAEHSFRSLLYQAETLRAFGLRYAVANSTLSRIQEAMKKPMDAAGKKQWQELLQRAKGDMNEYLQSLSMGANYLKTSLSLMASQPDSEINRLIVQTKEEYGGKGVFYEHMRQNISTLQNYINLIKSRGPGAVTQQTILKGLLPEQLYKILPNKG